MKRNFLFLIFTVLVINLSVVEVEAASSGPIESVNITANVFDRNYSDTNPITVDPSVTVIPQN